MTAPAAAVPPDALRALEEAVGGKWVSASPESLAPYLDPYPLLEVDPYVPAAAVRPGSVEEVQAVIRAAARYRLHLWTVSRGKNRAYGGAAPAYPGCVTVDLSRMNRILEFSEELGYVVVEPGVSYADLYEFLTASGSDWWADIPDLGWGSPLGNALERGNGYTPAGDHFAAVCGMEVALADGTLLRTGMGALPGSRAWHLFKYGYGPYLDGIFTQSNYGIVTRCGIQLMRRPPGFRPYMVMLPRQGDIGPAADILRRLRLSGAMQNTSSARSLMLEAASYGPRRRWHSGPGPVPRGLHQQIADELDIGAWNVYGAQYGTPEMMRLLWQEIEREFRSIPGARFAFAGGRPPGSPLEHRADRMSGKPGLQDLDILRWAGENGGHVNFSPVSPARADDALALNRMCRDRCLQYGVDYMADMIVGERELHTILMVMFDAADPAQQQAALLLCRQLVDDAAKAGYGEYRTHLALMNQVAATFSWGGDAFLRTAEKLKDALDPQGIFAPGKSGIWPAHLRDTRLAGGARQHVPDPPSE